MKKPEVKLNPSQQEAVDWDRGPLLVLAGPGTGKTQLLSARVERILQNTDTSAETILCLTFTESGANNMRERLLSTIGPEARKVNIHTYHAFGQVILSKYKSYAEHFDRLMESPIDTVTQFKIVKNIQDDLPAMDILRSAATSDIISTISSAKSARLTPDDLAKIAEHNINLSAELSSEITPVLAKIIPRMKAEDALPIYEEILTILAEHSSPKPIVKNIEPIANELTRSLSTIIDEVKAMEKPKISPLSDWKRANFEANDDGGYRLKDYIANKKLVSLAKIMTEYQAALEREGLYDFADMIEEAIAILKKDRGFRLSVSEHFQHILLDEFQDTNPSQFELIRLITDYEQPDVMAVGDDDQAIFEFQGANASNLWDYQQHYQAHLVNLDTNYRSYSEIIDTAKRVSGAIEGSFSRQSGVAKLLTAFRGNSGEVIRHEFLSSDAEYYWVAEQIAALVATGVSQKDIAVIMPKHKAIAPLLPYLKAKEGINIAYEKRDNLLLDPKLSELLTLADFIYALANEKPASHRLLEILAFPFWQIPPLSAISIVNSARADKKSALDYLANSEDQKLKTLADFIATLALKSFDTPLELFFDYLTGSAPVTLASGDEFRSPFIEFYGKDSDSYATFELYENLAVLKEQIKKHVHSENPRLADLITFIEDYEAAGEALTNTSPYCDSEQAVQILTAHKSKGLEFPYVFLMSVDSNSWGRAKGNNNMLALPKNLIQIRHTGITDDERRRLLFVAMTRARNQLIMTNSLFDFAGKSPARLEYLEEAEQEIEGKKVVVSPFLPSGAQAVITHYEDFDEAKKCTDLKSSWTAAYLKPEPEMRNLLKTRMAEYKLSATDLTTFIDITYAGPLAFYRSKVLRAPSEPSTFAMEYGNLVHSTFEKVTSADLSDQDALDFFRREALNTNLEKKDQDLLLEKGSIALETSLKSFGAILRAQNSKAELNLAPEHLSIAGVPVTGKIDHLSVNPETKEIEIYDFKTGSYHTEKWGSHATLFKYALQLSFYRLMLAASPTWSKYKCTKAHILFVTPDNEGKVYDKTYDFDIDDDWLKTLIQAVHRHAITLDFLDNPACAIEPDSAKTLKDIKKFIEDVII